MTKCLLGLRIAMGIACGGAAFLARPADLCVDGLCVVRAQVAATTGLMTQYQPILLTLENRSGQPRTIKTLASSAAEDVRILNGSEWDPPRPPALRIDANEYRTLDAATEWRVMLVGLRQPLEPGQVIYLNLSLSNGRRLVVPVSVI